MRCGLLSELVRGVSRFVLIGAVGSLAAACSSDAMRFSDTPFANPFSAKQEPEPGMTGSIDARRAAAPRVPRTTVSSAPLAPLPTRSAAAPAFNRPAPVSAAPVTARAPSPTSSSGGWTVEGGTAITVRDGDSINAIADRYGVPPKAILSANGMTSAQAVSGRRIIIPVYSTTGGAARVAEPAPSHAAAPARVAETKPLARRAETAPEPRSTASIEPKAHVRPGQPKVAAATAPASAPATAKTAAQTPAKPVAAAAAKPEKPPQAGKVVKSEPLPVVPAKPKAVAAAAPAPAKQPAKPEPQPAKVAAKAPPPAAQPAPKVAAVEPAKAAEAPKVAPSREPESTASLPAAPAAPTAEFRWPARGRVISGFGGSGSNEGINIAVPDGTPVKAAEAGTVAYAGSEVKGYGNLVLIRHDNGYVSAYAHNGDVEVKRGQKVTRGQTIAKSGQTGNVTSPQIHFEIRKGSTPVDPMRYLASSN
ncbi:MAG: LysM peptidoglycan-binding protein [Enterovirga sp.]|jgi:murein DD-endopeptidase MepM/ murein hydrolase activator NlpD|nr:LysM peptidoglycan-binding protein [Enterovirga sp.]